MRTLSSRILLATGPILIVAAAATGCSAATPSAEAPASASGAASAAPSAAPSSTGQAAGAGATTGRTTGSNTSKSSKIAACKAGDVRTTVTAQDTLTTGASVRAMITLVNTSSRTCRVTGWTTVTLVNAAGEAAPMTIRKVEEPGPAEKIDLKPNTSALAGLKWTQCDKGDDTCAVGNTLEVGLPGATGTAATLEAFPSPEKSGIAMKSALLGPLQSSRQGVVAW
jgi:hypothetical protein